MVILNFLRKINFHFKSNASAGSARSLTISRKYRPHLPRPPVRRFTSCRKRCVRPSPPCSARSREPTRSARAETGRSPRLEERPDATNRRASQEHGGDGNQAGVRRDFEF